MSTPVGEAAANHERPTTLRQQDALDPRVEAAAAAMWWQRPMIRLDDGSPLPWADLTEGGPYAKRYRAQAAVALAAADGVPAIIPGAPQGGSGR